MRCVYLQASRPECWTKLLRGKKLVDISRNVLSQRDIYTKYTVVHALASSKYQKIVLQEEFTFLAQNNLMGKLLAKDRDGDMPLQSAVYSGADPETIDFILNFNHDARKKMLENRNKYAETALEWCLSQELVDIFKLLLEHSIKCRALEDLTSTRKGNVQCSTLLHQCIEGRHVKILRTYMEVCIKEEAKISLCPVDEKGRTPWNYLICYKEEEIEKFKEIILILQDHKINLSSLHVNKRSKETMLHMAYRLNRPQFIACLEETCGSTVDQFNRKPQQRDRRLTKGRPLPQHPQPKIRQRAQPPQVHALPKPKASRTHKPTSYPQAGVVHKPMSPQASIARETRASHEQMRQQQATLFREPTLHPQASIAHEPQASHQSAHQPQSREPTSFPQASVAHEHRSHKAPHQSVHQPQATLLREPTLHPQANIAHEPQPSHQSAHQPQSREPTSFPQASVAHEHQSPKTSHKQTHQLQAGVVHNKHKSSKAHPAQKASWPQHSAVQKVRCASVEQGTKSPKARASLQPPPSQVGVASHPQSSHPSKTGVHWARPTEANIVHEPQASLARNPLQANNAHQLQSSQASTVQLQHTYQRHSQQPAQFPNPQLSQVRDASREIESVPHNRTPQPQSFQPPDGSSSDQEMVSHALAISLATHTVTIHTLFATVTVTSFTLVTVTECQFRIPMACGALPRYPVVWYPINLPLFT